MENLNELLIYSNNEDDPSSLYRRIEKIIAILVTIKPRSTWPGELKELLSNDVIYERPLYEARGLRMSNEERLRRISARIAALLSE